MVDYPQFLSPKTIKFPKSYASAPSSFDIQVVEKPDAQLELMQYLGQIFGVHQFVVLIDVVPKRKVWRIFTWMVLQTHITYYNNSTQ